MSPSKNIPLTYLLAFLKNSWFWLGIWVFYYLRFTDYAGIGLLESVMILTIISFEIPSGAVADLLGKKKTLIMSFVLLTLGNLIMGLAGEFPHLILSLFVMCIGETMYSGTIDALVYDSLVEIKDQERYEHVNANLRAIGYFAPAVAGAIGGFVYTINPRLPFLGVAGASAIGLILTFGLYEPVVDTEQFSWRNFVKQTKQGFNQLFKNKAIKRQTLVLLLIGMLVIIPEEMLDGILAVEFGYNAQQLGLFTSALYLISAAASKLTPWMRSKLSDAVSLTIVTGLLALSLLVSPLAGLVIGGLALVLRSMTMALYSNLNSIIINQNTNSKNRATTLSTFNMIKNFPYIISAFALGALMDIYSARLFAFILGAALLIVAIGLQIAGIKFAHRSE